MEFFEAIINGFYTFGLILYNLVMSIVRFVQMIPDIMEFITSINIYMPTYCAAFILASISISCILLIAGRK